MSNGVSFIGKKASFFFRNEMGFLTFLLGAMLRRRANRLVKVVNYIDVNSGFCDFRHTSPMLSKERQVTSGNYISN